jgi:hypothetical protein
MPKVALPFEVRASFRVPRQQAEKLVSKFKTGINFPGLLPDALKSSDAGIRQDSDEGSDATIWVVFKPRRDSNRVTQRSLEARDTPVREPVAESAYADFIGSEKGMDDLTSIPDVC